MFRQYKEAGSLWRPTKQGVVAPAYSCGMPPHSACCSAQCHKAKNFMPGKEAASTKIATCVLVRLHLHGQHEQQ